MKPNLGQICDAGLETCFAAGVTAPCFALPLGEHQSLGLESRGQKPAAEVRPRWGCACMGRKHLTAQPLQTALQAPEGFCSTKAHSITLEVLHAIAVARWKALVFLQQNPGNYLYKCICSYKCIFSAQIHSWGIHQRPSCSQKTPYSSDRRSWRCSHGGSGIQASSPAHWAALSTPMKIFSLKQGAANNKLI